MRAKHFFAHAASKALALAATVMMMSAAFTSCSKDSDDDNGGLPEPKAQTVSIDGAEKPILKAEYQDRADGNYQFRLYLSADCKEKVKIDLNKNLHMTGSPINLTKREEKHDGKYYWWVSYYKPNGNRLISAFSRPEELYNSGEKIDPVFTTGTLTMSGSPDGTINIVLKNGRVKGEDNKEHTLTINYSGSMTKVK